MKKTALLLTSLSILLVACANPDGGADTRDDDASRSASGR